MQKTQMLLQEMKLDGWLLYDFRRTNDLACHYLKIPLAAHLTRRFYYWIPQRGEPVKIIHAIEEHLFREVPGKKCIYSERHELEKALQQILKGKSRVAMEYSEIPYVSKVDGAVIDHVRSYGVQVVSSANLLLHFTAILSKEQLASHKEAAHVLDQTAAETWHYLSRELKAGKEITEAHVQQFIMDRIAAAGCIADSPPICAAGKNSALPHYAPEQIGSKRIVKGDVILIDLWCKKNELYRNNLTMPKTDSSGYFGIDAVYADISRMGVALDHPTARQQEIFNLVRAAQRAAFEKAQEKGVTGAEVDAASRAVIKAAGYGEYFTHRTGHNIYTDVHGPGTSIDSLEILDTRPLMPKTCFSLEPGIYIPGEFGMRLEHDAYLDETGGLTATGGIQEALVLLLK